MPTGYRIYEHRGQRPHTRAERDLLYEHEVEPDEARPDGRPPAWLRTCPECDGHFLCEGFLRYDTDECERDARLRRQRERRRVVHEDRDCDQCGESFTPTRSDARFCKTRCRVAAHRRKETTP